MTRTGERADDRVRAEREELPADLASAQPVDRIASAASRPNPHWQVTLSTEVLLPAGGPAVLTVDRRRFTAEVGHDLRAVFASPEIRGASRLVIVLERVLEIDLVSLRMLVSLCQQVGRHGVRATIVGACEPVANFIVAAGHGDLMAGTRGPH